LLKFESAYFFFFFLSSNRNISIPNVLVFFFYRNETATEAILLGERIHNYAWQQISLTASGEILTHLRTHIHFAVPNLISADLAARCGTDAIALLQPEIHARVEALKQLQLMLRQVEQSASGSRTWERQSVVDVYQEVKSSDPTKWAKVTLSEATGLLYTRPGFVNYYATHRYLMDRPLRFLASSDYLKTQEFLVRPERDVIEIEMVESWIAVYRVENRGPVRAFVKKARAAIAEYDETKRQRDAAPMSQETLGLWNKDDKIILKFLLRSLQQHRSNQLDPYQTGRSSLLKFLIPHFPEITDSLAHATMIKLGVIAPWQDLYSLSPLGNPTGDFETKSPLEASSNQILQKSLTSRAVAGAVLGPYDFLSSDPLESMRHDFGDSRVFVIDDPAAEELDDGISLERIPSEPDNHWVHVHIADPAAVLHPGHVLSKLAMDRGSTLYLKPNSIPLFPKALMHDPKFALSLGDTATTGRSYRSLSFSIKLDDKANLLDYKVRAGILRNVRKTSYLDVDRALGHPEIPYRYPFGRAEEKIETTTKSTLDEDDVADLRILQKLADDQLQKRFQQGLFSFTRDTSVVSWKDRPPEDIQSPSLEGSRFGGFPQLEYSVVDGSYSDMGSRSLVSEMMKLACRVSSRIALENGNVPLLRRGAEPVVFKPGRSVDEILKLRSPNGAIPMSAAVDAVAMIPPGVLSIQPNAHHFIGVPEGEGYSRVTSPLRRYEDLVGHWQLHHILLGANAPPWSPFSANDLEKMATTQQSLDLIVKRLHKANDLFYSLMYIQRFRADTARGVERPFGDPLKSMRAWTKQVAKRDIFRNEYAVVVELPDLGISAHLVDMPSELQSIPPGTQLRVDCHAIELGIKRLHMDVKVADIASVVLPNAI
jgi:exoribonuclease-2